ncbi:ABC transporter ATP-binding protein [Kitasatospora sp. NPDC058218]|uniref:ABC transporter ATP-binding protein n=1 Tax=Kitasatospora sp. NPDC058218 TaxID=3346385 RepID=UPI0036D80E4B
MLGRLLSTYARPHLSSAALVVALQLIQSFAALTLPALNADIVDNGVAKGDGSYVLRVGSVMLAATLVQILSAISAFHISVRTAAALGRDLRVAVFQRVQELSLREVGRFGASSLLTRTTNDVQQVQSLVLMLLMMMVTAPIMGVGGVLMAFHQDVPMSLLIVVTLTTLVLAFVLILRRMGPLSASQQKLIDQVNRTLREQIAGIRVVRAFVRDQRESERFGAANTELRDIGFRLGRVQAFMNPSVLLIIECSNIAVLWFGGHRVHAGSMQVGSMLALLNYLVQILQAVLLATTAFQIAPRARACAERIQEVLVAEPSVKPPRIPVVELESRGLLELRNVVFRYPGAELPVLRGADLVARPGETTAIIGSTGSGKSTLLRLVPRLFDADSGSARVGGVDVRDLDPGLLASTVRLVPQKPHLFSGTVASNLRYGAPDVGDEQLWRALEVAQAREFVEALPGGLDHPITQGGRNLSGGQRQRLAIARALAACPDIYLLDDCFSALDHATDAAARRALARETENSTVVIVAQRVSTIRDADRIVVLDEGQVVGTGTHAELLRTNSTYQEIVSSQLFEEEAA